MARGARQISELGLYHVTLRGVAQQVIFYDDLERIMFLKRLENYSCEEFKIYAYCLMDNHIHLVVQTNKLSDFLKSICISFVWWYNANNERSGHLYQNRFSSEVINDEVYLLRCIRYVHNNPVKAGLCINANHFLWSSSHLYYNSKASYIDTNFIENLFSSKGDYLEYMGIPDEEFDNKSKRNKIGNKHLEQLLQEELKGRSVFQLSIEEKIAISNSLINCYFINKKHLTRLLGIPYRYLFVKK